MCEPVQYNASTCSVSLRLIAALIKWGLASNEKLSESCPFRRLMSGKIQLISGSNTLDSQAANIFLNYGKLPEIVFFEIFLERIHVLDLRLFFVCI